MIELKNEEQFALMREAGLIVQRTLAALRAEVKDGITTGELDEIAEASIRSQGAPGRAAGARARPRELRAGALRAYHRRSATAWRSSSSHCMASTAPNGRCRVEITPITRPSSSTGR